MVIEADSTEHVRNWNKFESQMRCVGVLTIARFFFGNETGLIIFPHWSTRDLAKRGG